MAWTPRASVLWATKAHVRLNTSCVFDRDMNRRALDRNLGRSGDRGTIDMPVCNSYFPMGILHNVPINFQIFVYALLGVNLPRMLYEHCQ